LSRITLVVGASARRRFSLFNISTNHIKCELSCGPRWSGPPASCINTARTNDSNPPQPVTTPITTAQCYRRRKLKLPASSPPSRLHPKRPHYYLAAAHSPRATGPPSTTPMMMLLRPLTDPASDPRLRSRRSYQAQAPRDADAMRCRRLDRAYEPSPTPRYRPPAACAVFLHVQACGASGDVRGVANTKDDLRFTGDC
jgi:hypothetical protein